MAAASESERQILGDNIRRRRQKLDWSQEQLAAEAGEMRQATISEIETAVGNPEWETLEKIAAALGTTIRELLTPARRRPAK